MKRIEIIFLLVVGFWDWGTIAAAEDTIRIIIERPEERKRTNRSLSEWLKLTGKATSEDFNWFFLTPPKRDSVQPELNLAYGIQVGSFNLDAANVDLEGSILPGETNSEAVTVKAELWLGNIVTATTGLRTLNIDMGIEGRARRLSLASYSLLGRENAERSSELSRIGMMFRLFGKHIQDSSLTIKGGQYELRTNTHDSIYISKDRLIGKYISAELLLYVFKFLGFQSDYSQYLETRQSDERTQYDGRHLNYGGFFELSVLRISYGFYQEYWDQVKGFSSKEEGTYIEATMLL